VKDKYVSGMATVEFNENRDFAMAAGLRYSHTRQGNEILSFPSPDMLKYDGEIASVSKLSEVVLLNLRNRSQDDNSESTCLPNEDELKIKSLAGKLAPEWRGEFMAPDLARRLRDFQFAQEKRRQKYGNERPWGILGLYDHLAAVRIDIEWAEEAVWRRAFGKPYLSWSSFDDGKSTGFNRPFFTYFLLVSCTVMLVISIGMNNWRFEPFAINPMIGPSATTLLDLGAKDSFRIVEEGEAWRIVTTMFLHAGIIHYLFNMTALFLIGSAVEKCHGSGIALVIFVVPAIVGSLLSAVFLPKAISVGASGGIFGLIGACLADIVLNWNLLFSALLNEDRKHRHVLILFFLFLDVVLNCLIGMTPFVDNFTHIGGMVFGFLCGLSILTKLSSDFFGVEQNVCSRIRHITIRCIGLFISAFFIISTFFLLFNRSGEDGDYFSCQSCRYLSCVPFPPWGSDNDQKWWYCDDCGTVSADLSMNYDTGKYDALTLSCPDNEEVIIGLGAEATSDPTWIQNNMKEFCRKKCKGRYIT